MSKWAWYTQRYLAVVMETNILYTWRKESVGPTFDIDVLTGLYLASQGAFIVPRQTPDPANLS